MLNATEVFSQLDSALIARDGEGHPFSDTLSQQIKLATQIQLLMTEAQKSVRVPEAVLGKYDLADRESPHSSTGEVFFVEQPSGESLALKLLTKLDNGQFKTNKDHMYAFHHPAVRIMTAVGEVLMGIAANAAVSFPIYFGVAGITEICSEGVTLIPFDVMEILAGKMEPVIVMRAMVVSMSDMLLDTIDAKQNYRRPSYTKDQLSGWTKQVLKKVLDSSVPLSPELAAEVGAPAEIESLMVGKTIGWLSSREHDPDLLPHPILVNAVQRAQQAQQLFQRFFEMPETQINLAKRAVPRLTNADGSLGKLAQTFSPGDTKLSNFMLGRTGSGEEAIGLLDPQWLILNPGAQGNKGHTFAPWPFADLMQIAAYAAAEPASYFFPQLQQVVYDGVRGYYGKEHWSEWHELYLKLLTSYKLLVDVAVNVDPFIQKKSHGQEIPRRLQWTMEKHPRAAIELAQRALRVYDDYKSKRR